MAQLSAQCHISKSPPSRHRGIKYNDLITDTVRSPEPDMPAVYCVVVATDLRAKLLAGPPGSRLPPTPPWSVQVILWYSVQ